MLKKLAILALPAILCGCATHSSLSDDTPAPVVKDKNAYPACLCQYRTKDKPLVFHSMIGSNTLDISGWNDMLRDTLARKFKTVRFIDEKSSKKGCDLIANPAYTIQVTPMNGSASGQVWVHFLSPDEKPIYSIRADLNNVYFNVYGLSGDALSYVLTKSAFQQMMLTINELMEREDVVTHLLPYVLPSNLPQFANLDEKQPIKPDAELGLGPLYDTILNDVLALDAAAEMVKTPFVDGAKQFSKWTRNFFMEDEDQYKPYFFQFKFVSFLKNDNNDTVNLVYYTADPADTRHQIILDIMSPEAKEFVKKLEIGSPVFVRGYADKKKPMVLMLDYVERASALKRTYSRLYLAGLDKPTASAPNLEDERLWNDMRTAVGKALVIQNKYGFLNMPSDTKARDRIHKKFNQLRKSGKFKDKVPAAEIKAALKTLDEKIEQRRKRQMQ